MTLQCIFCTKDKFLQSGNLIQSSRLDLIIGFLLFSYSAPTIWIVWILFGNQKMNKYKYRIPLFGPNYSNSWIVWIIRYNTGVGASVYGVWASVYGSLVIIVSAQVLWVLTLGLWDFGLGLDNFVSLGWGRALVTSLTRISVKLRPDSDLPDPHLTWTWPGPGPELDNRGVEPESMV